VIWTSDGNILMSPKQWARYLAACTRKGIDPHGPRNWGAIYEAYGAPADDSDIVEKYHVPLSDVLAWYLIGKQHEGRDEHGR
jgi:hypothetical protein